ncbi:hypothetical protein H4219_002790 [Mycoemilia scoparia]|uniref:Myb-like domain-containing protein n=1 Tax=Mycoemilia scoparia TaxID=417184 RepID=A0A9W7ZWP7_9FUNG|nr:hypothetical protein H4219_002790 [Mycoemilia scoparia]
MPDHQANRGNVSAATGIPKLPSIAPRPSRIPAQATKTRRKPAAGTGHSKIDNKTRERQKESKPSRRKSQCNKPQEQPTQGSGVSGNNPAMPSLPSGTQKQDNVGFNLTSELDESFLQEILKEVPSSAPHFFSDPPEYSASSFPISTTDTNINLAALLVNNGLQTGPKRRRVDSPVATSTTTLSRPVTAATSSISNNSSWDFSAEQVIQSRLPGGITMDTMHQVITPNHFININTPPSTSIHFQSTLCSHLPSSPPIQPLEHAANAGSSCISPPPVPTPVSKSLGPAKNQRRASNGQSTLKRTASSSPLLSPVSGSQLPYQSLQHASPGSTDYAYPSHSIQSLRRRVLSKAYTNAPNAGMSVKGKIKQPKWTLSEDKSLMLGVRQVRQHRGEAVNEAHTISNMEWYVINESVNKATDNANQRTPKQCQQRWNSIYHRLGDKIISFIDKEISKAQNSIPPINGNVENLSPDDTPKHTKDQLPVYNNDLTTPSLTQSTLSIGLSDIRFNSEDRWNSQIYRTLLTDIFHALLDSSSPAAKAVESTLRSSGLNPDLLFNKIRGSNTLKESRYISSDEPTKQETASNNVRDISAYSDKKTQRSASREWNGPYTTNIQNQLFPTALSPDSKTKLNSSGQSKKWATPEFCHNVQQSDSTGTNIPNLAHSQLLDNNVAKDIAGVSSADSEISVYEQFLKSLANAPIGQDNSFSTNELEAISQKETMMPGSKKSYTRPPFSNLAFSIGDDDDINDGDFVLSENSEDDDDDDDQDENLTKAFSDRLPGKDIHTQPIVHDSISRQLDLDAHGHLINENTNPALKLQYDNARLGLHKAFGQESFTPNAIISANQASSTLPTNTLNVGGAVVPHTSSNIDTNSIVEGIYSLQGGGPGTMNIHSADLNSVATSESNEDLLAFLKSIQYSQASLNSILGADSQFDKEISGLYQDAIQEGEEIDVQEESLEADNGEFLFSEDQLNLLRQQQLENFQLVSQALLVETVQHDPHTETARHWQSQLNKISRLHNHGLQSGSVKQYPDGSVGSVSFFSIPGITTLVPILYDAIDQIHRLCQVQGTITRDEKATVFTDATGTHNTKMNGSLPGESVLPADHFNDLIQFSTECACTRIRRFVNPLLTETIIPLASADTSKKGRKRSSAPESVGSTTGNSNRDKAERTPPSGQRIKVQTQHTHTGSITPSSQQSNVTLNPTARALAMSMHKPILPKIASKDVLDKNKVHGISTMALGEEALSGKVIKRSGSSKPGLRGSGKLAYDHNQFLPSKSEIRDAIEVFCYQVRKYHRDLHRVPRNKRKAYVVGPDGQTKPEWVKVEMSPIDLPSCLSLFWEGIITCLGWNRELKPYILTLRKPKNRIHFMTGEDDLLLRGLQLFGFEDTSSMCAHLLPCKTNPQLRNRINNLRARRAPQNPVKDFCLRRITPFTLEEEEILRVGVMVYGDEFKQINREFLQARPTFAIKRVWDHIRQPPVSNNNVNKHK